MLLLLFPVLLLALLAAFYLPIKHLYIAHKPARTPPVLPTTATTTALHPTTPPPSSLRGRGRGRARSKGRLFGFGIGDRLGLGLGRRAKSLGGPVLPRFAPNAQYTPLASARASPSPSASASLHPPSPYLAEFAADPTAVPLVDLGASWCTLSSISHASQASSSHSSSHTHAQLVDVSHGDPEYALVDVSVPPSPAAWARAHPPLKPTPSSSFPTSPAAPTFPFAKTTGEGDALTHLPSPPLSPTFPASSPVTARPRSAFVGLALASTAPIPTAVLSKAAESSALPSALASSKVPSKEEALEQQARGYEEAHAREYGEAEGGREADREAHTALVAWVDGLPALALLAACAPVVDVAVEAEAVEAEVKELDVDVEAGAVDAVDVEAEAGVDAEVGDAPPIPPSPTRGAAALDADEHGDDDVDAAVVEADVEAEDVLPSSPTRGDADDEQAHLEADVEADDPADLPLPSTTPMRARFDLGLADVDVEDPEELVLPSMPLPTPYGQEDVMEEEELDDAPPLLDVRTPVLTIAAEEAENDEIEEQDLASPASSSPSSSPSPPLRAYPPRAHLLNHPHPPHPRTSKTTLGSPRAP
ncbi:hypothetical protein C8R46DRAFT_1212278 [Mycena filopes]|nr:hypothetical protein C8R46DRAFT_1212278 [Mycena filopes]